MPKLGFARAMTRERRDLLLEWLRAEGLNPSEIADDGTFSVHNGHISGNKFLIDETGAKIIRNNQAVAQFFRVPQQNPLPPELVVG